MNFQRRPAVRFRVAMATAAVLLAVMAWGAVQLRRGVGPADQSDIPMSATTLAIGGTRQDEAAARALGPNSGDDSFLIAQTSNVRGPIRHGDAAALAAFATTLPSGALTAIAANGDPAKGTFSPVVDWPLVGIHAVLTPDGRVLSYGTRVDGIQTGYYIYDVWNPQLGLGNGSHTVLPNNTAVDIFCNAQLLLPNGEIEAYGGDVLNFSQGWSTNTPNDGVVAFKPLDNSLARTGTLNRKRWYATATTLPNGEVYIQGGNGGADFPEVRTGAGTFRLLTGASTNSLAALYPRNFVAPDGRIFGYANNAMYRIDPSGLGSFASAGTIPTSNTGGSSTAVMFRPGRILQIGGGNSASASLTASQININGASPAITTLPSPVYRRHWGNATVMADGRVFVSGGSTANNDPASGVAYTSEIYDPVANSWSPGATAQRMRLYHSGSLLLPDATVLTLGGGALGGGNPGPQLNLNAELYYPPYLFNADGTPAARPIISSSPMTANPAQPFRIGTADPAAISRVTLVKAGSVTHSFDMDQRFLELPYTVLAGELEATLPANAFDTPPGFYLVFVFNQQGVPSEAAMLRINVPPPPATTLTVSKLVVNDSGGSGVAADFSFSLNGAAPVAFESDGTNVLSVAPGTYTITEPARAGYVASLSGCSGIVLAAGGNATCTITNNDLAAAAANLVINGDFENNSVPDGNGQLVGNLAGWSNTGGGIEVWRNYLGYTPGLNASYIELDGSGSVSNQVYQDFTTTAAATYDLSFLQSPRPGNASKSNRFDVYWNNTQLTTITRNGKGVSNTVWQTTRLTVTGTGADRLSFREYDSDDRGALIDDVRLTRR